MGNATAVRGRESTARHLPSARQNSRDRGARQDARLVCSRENQSQRRDEKGRDKCDLHCGTSTPERKSNLATTCLAVRGLPRSPETSLRSDLRHIQAAIGEPCMTRLTTMAAVPASTALVSKLMKFLNISNQSNWQSPKLPRP